MSRADCERIFANLDLEYCDESAFCPHHKSIHIRKHRFRGFPFDVLLKYKHNKKTGIFYQKKRSMRSQFLHLNETYMKCIHCIRELNNGQRQQSLDLCLVLSTTTIPGDKIGELMLRVLQAEAITMAL